MRRRQLPGEPPPPTKSELKREAQSLQALADALVEAPAELLDGLGLPDKLADAIALARRISQHGARLRQRQFVGKLLRGLDPAPIRAALEAADRENRQDALRQARAERWRDRLLEDGERALADFAAECPAADRQQLPRLIAAAAAERDGGRPAGAGRALFRWLRDALSR